VAALACDPAIHRRLDVPIQYDISFVGRFCPGPRNDLLDLLRSRFPDHFIGQAQFEEMARIYSASRIVFNRSIRNDVNMRVFEALASGSLLITNDLSDNGQEELFQDGKQLATYRDPGELLEKITYYLAHADEREAIAAAGLAEALAKHTYRHRMERLLAEAESRLSRRMAASPLPQPARSGAAVTPGLTSIIIPCWNQLEFTRRCIASLKRHTRAPWELLVINNGSTDGTKEYLAGVQDGAPVPVTVIDNAINRGFPSAVNQGLQFAHGEYLVLLNNDVVVTEGWLDQLIALTTAKTGPTAKNAKDPREDNEGDDRVDCGGEEGERQEGNAGAPLFTPPGGPFTPHGEPALPVHPALGGPFTPHGDPALPVHPPVAPPSQGGESMFASECVALLAAKTRHGPDGVDSTIGLAGPMSNYAAPPQLVEEVPYRNLEEMPVFARRWGEQHRGQWFTVPKLSGFCLLMKRAVYVAIGGLDERFGLGFFDDDDLAERARRAGFDLAVAHDLFVHHFGSRTLVGNGVDAERLLDENARRFAAKWGLPGTTGRRVALRPWNGSSGPRAKTPRAVDGAGEDAARNGPKLATNGRGLGQAFQPDVRLESLTYGKQCRVSLTMIVRDEENNLSHALESVAGLFDEIVIVDTGSTDRTIEIARSFGARVFDFVWVDDFAAPRNSALARATGDYAFWLDADDVVDPPEREKLGALLDRLKAGDEDAYVVRCACDPGQDGSGGDTVVDHIRLFPLREDVRWTYRVHEQILPALRRAGIREQWTDVIVRHTGYTDRALRARKLDRDSRILREELEDRPHDPFVLFNLGSIAVERQEWREALEYLRRSLAGSAPTDSITRKLYALIARAHQMLGEPRQALAACAAGLAVDADDAELLFREAVVRRQSGDSAGAEGCWRRILTLSRPEQFSSVDQGIYGHLTRRNLAALATERGDLAEAVKLWTEVLAECPGDREALAKLSLVPGL